MNPILCIAAAAALIAPRPVHALPADTVVQLATAEVRAGLAHSAESRAGAAAAAYARAAQRLPSFASWSHALSASAAAKVGDTAAVRRHLEQSDPVLAREWGWRSRVDAALQAGDSGGAARHAEQAAAQMTNTDRRVEAWTRAGIIHARARRIDQARAALRRAIDTNIGSTSAVDAARTLGELGSVTSEDRLRIGRVYLRHGNRTRAAEAFDAYAQSGVSAQVRAELNLDLGRAHFGARDYAPAERRLRNAITTAPDAARDIAAEAMFLLGRAQYRQSRTTDARATFIRVTREYAGTQAAARAHFVIADIDHDADRIESARTHYRAVIEARGPDEVLAAVRLGSLALLEGRPRDAARLYESVYARARTPADRQQAGFWWARSLERAGAADSAKLVLAEVRAIDPFSWYGLIAGESLGVGIWDFAKSEPAPLLPDVKAAIAAGIDVVDVLREVGLNEAAQLESMLLVERFGAIEGALYELGDAYHARSQTAAGIRIGRELQRREGAWNRRLLQLVYPMPYRDAILREARANNVDPWLMAGLIRQESMFDTRARSGAGAIGLMQVMPNTGRRVAQAVGVRPFAASDLTEPNVNLRIGARYLAEQVRAYNGRIVDAVAAYNAGPSRVARWKSFPEYRDPELFADRIPFEETRNYVKIVQQNARIYRILYGTDAS